MALRGMIAQKGFVMFLCFRCGYECVSGEGFTSRYLAGRINYQLIGTWDAKIVIYLDREIQSSPPRRSFSYNFSAVA